MTSLAHKQDTRVESVDVTADPIPTATEQESDGTLVWDSTTVVVVEIGCGEHKGLGYTYCHPSAGQVIQSKLADVIREADPLMPQKAWAESAVRRDAGPHPRTAGSRPLPSRAGA